MKKLLLAIIFIAAYTLPTLAQQKVYVCDGYRYESVEIASADDITFSADGSTINLGASKSYPIAEFDSITFTEPQFRKVTITYNGASATVDVPSTVKGVTYSVNGADVVINSTTTTEDYLYSATGSSDNGSLTINGDFKLSLELDGLTLTSKKGAAIDIECGKRIAVILKEGTVSKLTDCANGVQKGAFYTEGHPEFEGSGTLYVAGLAKHAICAKEYLQLKKSLGEIYITSAVSDGIHCGKGKENNDNCYFQMNGGKLTIDNAGSDCIDADDYGCMYIKGGVMNLNVSATDGTGLKCDSILLMTGGEVNIDITGNLSEGIRTCYEAHFDGGTIKANVSANGTKGIKGKKCTKATDTVLNGGHLFFGGTNVEMTVSGGTYTIDQTKCMGIRADQNFTQTAGNINMTVTNSAAVSLDVKGTKTTTGGTFTVK